MSAQEKYFKFLNHAVFNIGGENSQSELADMGRELLNAELLPEDYLVLHQLALNQLARENPDLKLSAVAERLMAPLKEISAPYRHVFHQQLDAKVLTQNRLAQAGRLEAIGTMAAGIAHDFNTILGIISGYAELIGEDMADNVDCHAYSVEILSASMRARDLIVRMLAFARQTPIEPILVDAVALVKNALQMIRITLPFDIEIAFFSEFEHAYTLADPLQIEQIVMNLCLNAADAMDRKGKLDIEIRHAPAKIGVDSSHFRRFCIVVDDDGCGMSPELQQRVLDPFFTTKEPGKGSGLGLSVVYGIVTDLGGELQIHSEVGMGSSFHILLPLKGPHSDTIAAVK